MPIDLLWDAFLRYSRIQALDEIRTRRILREKADCKESNVKRLEPAHLSTGPVDNNKLDTPKQLEVKR